MALSHKVDAAPPLVAARGVGRLFGAHVALAGVDLEVGAGESVAIVGPNGAGKSTLLSLLAGALEPSFGHVEHPAEVRIGWAPQQPAHYGRLTARENLALFARLGQADLVAQSHKVVDELLAAFELPPDSLSATLSVGQRQRLNLALAFLGEPTVVLLDEPTASLDEAQRARLWVLAAQIRANGGAVVFASQESREVAEQANRVVALEAGRPVPS